MFPCLANTYISFRNFCSPMPSTDSFVASPSRVAVVGCGVGGLGASWILGKTDRVSLTLFEAGSHLGGHASTHTVEGGRPIDTGFLVYNENTYPNLIGLFEVRSVEHVTKFWV